MKRLLRTGADANRTAAGWLANLHWDLVPKWTEWEVAKASISWPPNDGCVAAAVAETMPAGTTIDRFGSKGGAEFPRV
jgi:hypothetical protein